MLSIEEKMTILSANLEVFQRHDQVKKNYIKQHKTLMPVEFKRLITRQAEHYVII